MNKTHDELCAEAYRIQTNFFFQSTQFFMAVLNTTGTILVLYVSVNIFAKKIFHINLRILSANLFGLLLFRSVVIVFRSTTFIYRMIAYKDQCSFLEDSVKCSILSISGATPLKCIRYAFIAITIERFIAMCFYQRYEKWKYPIALAFIPLTWFEIAPSIKDIALLLGQSEKISKSYCSSITTNTVSYLKLALEIPLLIGIFFLLVIAHIISKRKMIFQIRGSMDLSSRYQIRENMKTSKTMFIATEITSFAIAIFINAISILLIVRVERLHDGIKWLFLFGCGPSNKVGDELRNSPFSGRKHVEIIEEMWEKGIHK
ncbi:Serpentine type 7TM GPCR receptor class ab chemoreceptor family protein [Acanthocheilonema viteae]